MSEFKFTRNDRAEVVDALKEIFLSPLGADYKKNYYTPETGDEDCEKILNAAETLSGGSNITGNLMARGLELLITSGEIQPRESEEAEILAEPEEDTRPRDKNGKLLSPQQIAWSEYRTFCETASMAEINRRKQVDQGFANFVRKSLQREMTHEIGDAVVPVGAPTSPRVAPTPELVAFAQAYQAELSENLRPKGGFIKLRGEMIPYNKFIETVNRATACGLL
jgi:hypothetical protein